MGRTWHARRLVAGTSVAAALAIGVFGLVAIAAAEGCIRDERAKLALALVIAPNFGETAEGIFRSGQANRPVLAWLWGTYRFRTVLNLAWSGSPADLAEERFLSARGVAYLKHSWSADGPPDAGELSRTLEEVDRAARPLLVHCRAGRDRTGGLIGLWRIEHGFPLEKVKDDWTFFGVPSPGWRHVLEERTGSPARVR